MTDGKYNEAGTCSKEVLLEQEVSRINGYTKPSYLDII